MGICTTKNDELDSLQVNQNNINMLEKNICKIYKTNSSIENGFFSKIPYPDKSKLIPVLISSSKILNKQDIENTKNIKIFYNDFNNNKIQKIININESRKTFTNEYIDISIIEIIPSLDGIDTQNFLEIDDNVFQNNYDDIYKEHTIYILNYPNGQTTSYVIGSLNKINDKKINYYFNTDSVLPELPILSLSNNKVIGINKTNNEGIFIKFVIEEFNNSNNLNLNNNNILNNKSNIIEMIIDNNEDNEIDEDNNIFRICNYLENSINNNNNNNNKTINKSYIELFINDNFHDYKKFTKLSKGIFNLKIKINAIITDCRNLFVFCCKNLIDVNLSSFDVKNVSNMSYMFRNCEKLKNIDFSLFDTSNTVNMGRMFMDCKSLTNLDLSTFNIRNVKKIGYMFHGCENLININLSSFDTINVKEMNDLFHGCKNLRNIDLSSFNTKNVTNISRMFMDCNSLININLSNFDTTNVTNMSRMFMNCNNLISLNLSNFIVGNVKDMNRMFFECENLKTLNLSFFEVKDDINVGFMFNGCRNLKEIYIKGSINFNNIINQTKNDKINCKISYV